MLLARALLVLGPATAAGLAAGAAADWAVGAVAAASAFLASVAGMATATTAATARFLAAAESPELGAAEASLAARVGLDLETVRQAKVAVRAAVRATMVHRAAGLAALAAPRSVVRAVPARAAAPPVSVEAGSLEPEECAGSAAPDVAPATAATSTADRPALLSGPGSATERAAAEVASKDRRDDVE